MRSALKILAGPGPLFVLLPFEPLWNIARAGHVRPGDAAPDFDLQTLD